LEIIGFDNFIQNGMERLHLEIRYMTQLDDSLAISKVYEVNMITNGEHIIEKVIAIMPDGKTGTPCGACRELMVQFMPDDYQDIEIMMDYEAGKVVTLGTLTPEWWIGK